MTNPKKHKKVKARQSVYKRQKRLVATGRCRCCGKLREPERKNRTRCLTCAKKEIEYAKKYKVLNREKILKLQRNHYWRNKDKSLKTARTWRENARLKVYEKYGGAICSCCGETRLPFLTLDHINNDGYKHRKKGGNGARIGGGTYLWAIKNNYPPTLRVLCYNCNSGRHRNGGVCPHEEERKLNDKSKVA